jgi:SAM-dependent methyltransferase
MTTVRHPEVNDFFSNWQVYQTVLETNSMEHRQIFAAVADILKERTTPFTLLDLGCGDATAIAPLLRDLPLQGYVGVDCTAPVLELARTNLGSLGDRARFEVGDLLEYLETSHGCVDLILVSFALHHLANPAHKRRFLELAYSHLNPGGELILVDIVRRPGQSREQYVERYGREVVPTWPIPPRMQAQILDHVRANDWPEEADCLPDWGRELGYAAVVPFFAGVHDTERGWRFQRG